MKHLGHRTKYRTGTQRQTQPPAAISSQAILIAGVVVWVIPSVILYEALSFFSPAQERALGSLCMTLSWQSNKQTSNLRFGWLRRYWPWPYHSCVICVREFTHRREEPGPGVDKDAADTLQGWCWSFSHDKTLYERQKINVDAGSRSKRRVYWIIWITLLSITWNPFNSGKNGVMLQRGSPQLLFKSGALL